MVLENLRVRSHVASNPTDLEAIGKANFSTATLTLHDNLAGIVLIQAINIADSKKVSPTVGNGEPIEVSPELSPAILRYNAEMEARKRTSGLSAATLRRMESILAGRKRVNQTYCSIKKKSIRFTFVRRKRPYWQLTQREWLPMTMEYRPVITIRISNIHAQSPNRRCHSSYAAQPAYVSKSSRSDPENGFI